MPAEATAAAAVTVAADELLEIAAQVEAMVEIHIRLCGRAQTPFSEKLSEQAWHLYELAHGKLDADDSSYLAFNARVDAVAREWLSDDWREEIETRVSALEEARDG